LNRNERSHWSGNGVHVESELVFMIGRNMQAPESLNTGAVMRGSWRRKARNQLGHASWLDVVEAALWCFWHSDDLKGGEALLGVLLGSDSRVRLVYGMLCGAFYHADTAIISANPSSSI